MKATFSFIDEHADLIATFCPNAEIYCETWVAFLTTNGWTEEEYQKECDNQLFNRAN